MADLQTIEKMVRLKLKIDIKDANPSEDDIRNAIKDIAQLLEISDKDKSYIEKLLQSNYKVRMDLGEKVINAATYHPWVANSKAAIDFYYWKRYCMYLELDQCWTSEVVDSLDKVSDIILDLCGDPKVEGKWKRKGLLLGDIQSGKTSNYLALCNKAADSGYKIIILLTGMIEGLRKQTQGRIDAGFVGINSRNVLQKNPEKKYIGVGNINSNRTAMPFTDIISDFNSAKLQSLNFTIKGMPEPVILVLKKNKSVLENLETWLSTRNTSKIGAKIDLPLLLIDDEADNASVNTNKPDKEPTVINKAIVNVLKLFNRASYVAVTATPFANIFIDPDLDKGVDEFNLFPSDFIYVLSAPSNYIGSNKIFSEEGLYRNSLEVINDTVIDAINGTYVFRSKATSKHIVPYLPKSLMKAIYYFLIVNTVMDLKGCSNSHRSMLINVSQYVEVQNQLYDLVSDFLKKLQTKIQSYSKLGIDKALKHEEISELFKIWDEYHMQDKTEYSKEQIIDSLYESTTPIQLRLVNQKAKEKGVERLDYDLYKDNGLRVIAIGGNSLSRGLTLEGLCVSYFDRNSQMYDTLMQMGRWFGYREGYDDLFKIWMQPTAMNWYQYISDATNELKNEISEMRRIGLTPKEFGLKIQQNMVSLFVTARSKMRATKLVQQWVSLAAEVVETPKLIANKEKCLEINLAITNKLIKQIEDEGNHVLPEYNFSKNSIVYTGVNKDIVAKYISAFVSHPRHIPFSAIDLSEHIQNSTDFLNWTVVFIGGSGQKLEEEYFESRIIERNIHYSSRVMQMDDNCLLIYGQRARVGVPGATRLGLTEHQIDKIKSDFMSIEENKLKKTMPDKPYLRIKREPVLLIYLIKIDKEVSKENRVNNSDEESIRLVGDYPVVGLGLGFPGQYAGATNQSAKVKYVLNRVSERDMRNFEEDIEDESE